MVSPSVRSEDQKIFFSYSFEAPSQVLWPILFAKMFTKNAISAISVSIFSYLWAV